MRYKKGEGKVSAQTQLKAFGVLHENIFGGKIVNETEAENREKQSKHYQGRSAAKAEGGECEY